MTVIRPTYPLALVDELIGLAGLDGSRAVLEVGAGTGKATMLFAERGIPVVAVEPSAEMAAAAGRSVAGYGDVEIEQSGFEAWDPRGILAPFWNRVAWEQVDVRDALLDVYERVAPELSRDGPMHPANLLTDAGDHWEAAIAGVNGLSGAEVRTYEWHLDYSASEYSGLLGTASEIRLLDTGLRESFLTAIREAIEAHGEPVKIAMRSQLCLARRGPGAAPEAP